MARPDWRRTLSHGVYPHRWPVQALALPFVSFRLRARGLRLLGYDIPLDARISYGAEIYGKDLRLATGVYMNTRVLINAYGGVSIGANVHIAPRVQILSTGHEVGDSHRRAGRSTAAPVHIGDGAWVGAGAIILPGVEVGRGCIVAAGAVVTRSTAPDGLYAGVPARRVRDLPAASL
jgi:maltose O-acetyltransferase